MSRSLRILVVGATRVDSSEVGCVRGLEQLGHTAEISDLRKHLGVPAPLQRYQMAYLVAEYLLRSTVREPFYLAQRYLIEHARRFRADLVLVVQLAWVLPETIKALRDAGVTCVGWYPDAITNFGRGSFFLAPWNALFFQDPFIVDRFKTSLGFDNVYHLPQCCDPVVHRPVPVTEEDRRKYGADVATFGNFYPYRAKLVEPLLTGDLVVKLWGARPPLWLHHKVKEFWGGHEVQGEQKSKAMLSCKIALNTNHYAGIADVNKRTFELAGIGAFQLTDDRPALRNYFEPGREVATFTGRADLREKVEYYLNRPEERAEIARRAQERAHRDHTFKNRLHAILLRMGLADAA